MSRSQFIQKQPLNADGDLDSIFWQNFPCHYPSGFAELSARYSKEAGRTLEQKHGHAPSFCPCLYQPIRGQDRGEADQSEAGSLRHADLWNNFTLLTPAQATPPSLPQTANSPLGTEFSAGTKYFMLAKSSILSSAA